MSFLITKDPIAVEFRPSGDPRPFGNATPVANIEELSDLKTSLLVDIYNHLKPADEPAVKVFQSKAKAIPRVWQLMLGLLPAAKQGTQAATTFEGAALLIFNPLDLAKCLTVNRYPDAKAAKAAQRIAGLMGNTLVVLRIENESDCNQSALHFSTVCDILRAWGIEDAPQDRDAAARLLFATLVTKYKDQPFAEPPQDEPTGDEDMAKAKRGNASPRKIKATTERKKKAPKVAKERNVEASTPKRKPRTSGESREGTVTAEVIKIWSRDKGASKKETLEILAGKFPGRELDNTVRGYVNSLPKTTGRSLTKEKDEKRGLVYKLAAA